MAWFDDADDDKLAEEFGVPNFDDYTPETFNEYLKAFIMVPKGDEILKAQVISRRKDHNGNPIGLIIDHALDATAMRADDGFLFGLLL